MSKKVIVISSSPRKGGNSETLANEFARGATEAGNCVEKICLHDKKISFCRGCLACLATYRCVIHDDADAIAQKMLDADVLVFATPVYYYSVSGQLKTMLDRANPLYSSDYKFRDVYLLATAADGSENEVEGARAVVQRWVDCFERAKLSGVVFAGSVNSVGEIKGHHALIQAYEMGKSI